MRKLNLEGIKINRLRYLRDAQSKPNNRKAIWLCDCGNRKEISVQNVLKQVTKSCGCLNKEMLIKRNTSHGMSRKPLYKKWCRIKHRCYDPKSESYPLYGGRGIGLSDDWKIFENFYRDMGHSYEDHLKKYGAKQTTIDRIDVNKGYSKENCRWATYKLQANNTRVNRIINYRGKNTQLPTN